MCRLNSLWFRTERKWNSLWKYILSKQMGKKYSSRNCSQRSHFNPTQIPSAAVHLFYLVYICTIFTVSFTLSNIHYGTIFSKNIYKDVFRILKRASGRKRIKRLTVIICALRFHCRGTKSCCNTYRYRGKKCDFSNLC